MDRLHYQHTVKQLQHIQGFRGLGWGLKETGNSTTSTVAWRVYVREKLPLLRCKQRIPAAIDGIPTDVIPAAATQQTKLPLSGSLIANKKGIPGTLGCLAYVRTEQQYVFLTNYHVLFSGGAKDNDLVWWDQQEEPSVFKQLGRTLYGKIGSVPYQQDYYYVDCAVGLISDKNVLGLTTGLNEKIGMVTAQPGTLVTKTGYATGLTHGIIVDTHYPDNAFINGIAYNAPNQLLIKPTEGNAFSSSGDSGAVILTTGNKITGLLWGSNARGEGVASHIAPVISELDLEIYTLPQQIQSNWTKMLHRVYSVFK